MARLKVIELTSEQRQELEDGYHSGKSHSFRQRCRIILLKSEKRTSLEIMRILGCSESVVNTWIKCFEEKGINGLKRVRDEEDVQS